MGSARSLHLAASLPRPATIQIFTFKEGLLSRLAHDLGLSVRQFDIELRGGHVRARFDVASAHIEGAVEGDRVNSTRFSKQDTDMIERNMRDAILNAARFPVVELEGDVRPGSLGRWVLHGELTMVGRTCELDVPLVRDGSELRAELDLEPSRWGIQPFTTMGGAIGIQDRWHVRVKLALAGNEPTELLRSPGVVRWGG